MHRQFADTTEKSYQPSQSNKTEALPNQIPEIKRSDNKFMTKRSKLENLLGNIKNKLTNKDNINNNTIASRHSDSRHSPKNESETLTETKLISFQTNKLPTVCSRKQKEEKTNEHQPTNSSKTVDDNVKTNESIDYNKTIDSRTSESTDGEDSLLMLRDNDILNDLENMNIPMQENEKKISEIGNSDLKVKDSNNSVEKPGTFITSCSNRQVTSVFLKTNNRSKCDSFNLDKTETSENNKHPEQENIIDTRNETIDNTNKNKTTINKCNSDIEKKISHSNHFIFETIPCVDDRQCTVVVNTEDNSQNEDSDIQKLTITSIEKISSPTLSDVDNSSCQEFDTISESYMKFIDEDISSLNSGYSSSDSKNLNEQTCDNKEVSTCRESIEIGSSQNEILEPTFKNEKDFESVEKITKFKNQKKKDKEYMTVYKIISCEDVTDDQVNTRNVSNDKDLKNIEKSEVFKKIISDNDKASEKSDSVKGNLNSFYKKCKSTYLKKSKSTSNNVDIEVNKNISIEHLNSIDNEDKNIDHSIEAEGDYAVEIEQTLNHDLEVETFCRSCETSKKSIVISDQNVVKYCLKCSCIFESESCTYCDKKAEIGKKCQQQIVKNSDSVKQCIASGDVKFTNK